MLNGSICANDFYQVDAQFANTFNQIDRIYA